MSNPMTPLDRARRVLELDAVIPKGPWTAGGCKDHPGESGRGLPCFKVRGPDLCEVFPSATLWVQEARTLAPDLARDAESFAALWKLCEPYCQHVPAIADKAREFGLLPERKEESDG